jgi:hypothetical protein
MDPPRATFLFADHKTSHRNHTNTGYQAFLQLVTFSKTGIFKELFVLKMDSSHVFWPKQT